MIKLTNYRGKRSPNLYVEPSQFKALTQHLNGSTVISINNGSVHVMESVSEIIKIMIAADENMSVTIAPEHVACAVAREFADLLQKSEHGQTLTG